LIVLGDRDDIIDIESCREWAEGTHVDLRSLRGTNHFFWAKYDALAETVTDWLDDSLVSGERREA
jgi:alpha/beta superfamily hydrolase